MPSAEDNATVKEIRALEARLQKAVAKYEDAYEVRRTYEQIVKRLKEERIGFANQLEARELTLSAKETDYEELLLLSGDSPLRAPPGLFQQMPQAEMAAGVTKAAWRVQSADALAGDVAAALRIAASGRPGPVHLALPADLLLDELDLPAAGPAQEQEARRPPPSLPPAAAGLLPAE